MSATEIGIAMKNGSSCASDAFAFSSVGFPNIN